MDALLLTDYKLVQADMEVDWPLEGNVWYDAVVEAMFEAGLEYPGELVALGEDSGVGQLMEIVDDDLRVTLQEVVRDVREKFEVLCNLNEVAFNGVYLKRPNLSFQLFFGHFILIIISCRYLR
jgi:hypothetical protein